MTFPSESQDTDTPSNREPTGSQLQACPHCEAPIDISEREPLEVVICPFCGLRFAVSSQISHYQVIEVAGRGGMGVVYKAYDPSLDRYVALKLLKKNQSNDAKLIELLETEAAITASINDPNVVRVYGTGRDRGRFFLAMELVENGSLDELIQLQGRVAEAQVLEVGIQIARGLRAAHQQGLIHRDVKPGNILFADAHTAKIVDFGLAIFMAQEENVRGEIWGTPYYVAPEKLDQKPEDFRSDMYSLGGTLFHALAGRPPFEAANASLVALKHLKSQTVRLQSFAPWASNATAHIINRTLEKNPINRYQSYDELIQNLEYALEELQKHGNVAQPRARVVMEANAQEHQKVWTWVVLSMVTVILGLAGYFVFANGSTKTTAGAKSHAEAPPAELASLEKEIAALANRDPNAAESFQAAANNSALSPTDRAWAQFLEGLSHLALNHTMEAHRAFARVEPLATRMKDESVAKFLSQCAARLDSSDTIALGETKPLNPTTHESIALLAYGLHNWHLDRTEDGAAMLREFRNARLNSSASWSSPLKALATTYMEELAAANMKKMEQLKYATSPATQSASPTTQTSNVFGQISGFSGPGLYRVVNKLTGDVFQSSLDVGGKLRTYEYRGESNQLWEAIRLSSGDFNFRPFHVQAGLDVLRGRTNDDAPIGLSTRDEGPNQRWKIEAGGGGFVKVRSALSQKLLSLHNPDPVNDAVIVQRTDDGKPDQLWGFARIGSRLNDEWFTTVVGEPTPIDGATAVNDQIVLTDQGLDIGGKKDQGTFVTQVVHGDFDVVARLVSIGRANHFTKAGLMIRENILPESRHVLLATSDDDTVFQQCRKLPEAPPVFPKEPIRPPSQTCWFKLERRGDQITGYWSPDGKTWNQAAINTVQMNASVFVGMALSSRDVKQKASATFDHLTVTKR